jgi:type I restriction enzyme S subunit
MITETTSEGLPKGWDTRVLKNCLEKLKSGKYVERGWSPQCLSHPAQDSWGVLKTTSVQMGEYLPEHNKELPKILEPKVGLEVNDGDFLVTTTGPRNRCGVVCHVRTTPKKLIFSGKILRFRADENQVLASFLMYLLMSPNYQKVLDQLKVGTSDSSVSIGNQQILDLEIPLASIKEQAKIVQILEEQFSRLDAALASVHAIREKAARFRRSLLHVAFTGMLTGHDTSDGGLPHGWSSGSLGDFCEMYQPKTISTKELIENGEFPVFGANGQIGFYNKYNHEDSEVTVTCRGATCGTVNVIPGKSWITGNAMVVRPIDNCMSKPLLSYQLQSLDFAQVITGTAQPQITRATLTEIKVVLPPPDEQPTIVQKLEEQLSRLDVSLEIVDAIERKASAMRRSLLHSAFTGELTREWREGASV